MFSRIASRINHVIERHFPERRLFLKSDSGMHFILLRPLTQMVGLAVCGFGVLWAVIATAIIFTQMIGAGSTRDQTMRMGQAYEQRLNTLATDRDQRTQEALEAQERFNLALEQVSSMQEMLLASEDRRRELETGVDVVQNTLRDAIRERDIARRELEKLNAAVQETGVASTEFGRAEDNLATLRYLTNSLRQTAQERDDKFQETQLVLADLEKLEQERRDLEQRHDAIFAKLEDAVTVSVQPLEKMFKAAGLNPDDLLKTVRRGYSGQGGPLVPISASGAYGSKSLIEAELRANEILKSMEEMDLYRIAAFKTPFAVPTSSKAVRYTSSFGRRSDPFNRGSKMHEGTDIAGPYGTPIMATADGVVTFAGWQNGYGRMIKVKHAYGIETRYAHLSQIRVSVGEKVSRGDRIGDMGNSGRSTGTHLHYEVRIDGSAVNPMTFIKAARNVF